MSRGRKLTRAKVIRLHKKWRTGKYSQIALAKEFGVTSATVNAILGGQIWADVYRELPYHPGFLPKYVQRAIELYGLRQS